MSVMIYEISAVDAQWNDDTPQPVQSVLMAEYNDGTEDRQAYLATDISDFSAIQHIVIGVWDRDTGANLQPVHDNYFTYIRKLGNIDGNATGELDSMRWAGHTEAKFESYSVDNTDPDNPVVTAERYPDTNRPFTLKIERTLITDDGFPQIPHGWKVTMLSDDPLRDITARAVGIYDSSGGYLYTTGAFIDDGSGTFFIECPVGQRTADKADVFFKLLLGAAPEGAFSLLLSEGSTEALFWSKDQGAPAGAAWSDSGVSTNGMVGTVTLVTPDNAAFSVGQAVRIDGNEFTVTSKWTAAGLVLDPYQATSAGLTIEILA